MSFCLSIDLWCFINGLYCLLGFVTWRNYVSSVTDCEFVVLCALNIALFELFKTLDLCLFTIYFWDRTSWHTYRGPVQYVITHPYPHFNGDLTKPWLKLGRGLIIDLKQQYGEIELTHRKFFLEFLIPYV